MTATKTLICLLGSLLLCSSACSSGSGTSAARPFEAPSTTQSVEEIEAPSTTQSVEEIEAPSTTQSIKEIELVTTNGTEAQIAELAARITELETEMAELRGSPDLQAEVTALAKESSTFQDEVVGLKVNSEALRDDVTALQQVDWSPTEETVLPVVESLVQQYPNLLRGPAGEQGSRGEAGPVGGTGERGPQGPVGPAGAGAVSMVDVQNLIFRHRVDSDYHHLCPDRTSGCPLWTQILGNSFNVNTLEEEIEALGGVYWDLRLLENCVDEIVATLDWKAWFDTYKCQ